MLMLLELVANTFPGLLVLILDEILEFLKCLRPLGEAVDELLNFLI